MAKVMELLKRIAALAHVLQSSLRLCHSAHRSRHLITCKASARMRQRRPLGVGAASALLMSGCDISLRAGHFNPGETLHPAALRDDMRVHAEWQGMDATQALDTPRGRHSDAAWMPSSMPMGPKRMAWPGDLNEP